MPVPVCNVHSEAPADWRCEGCGRLGCGACVKDATVGKVHAGICGACGGRCVPLTPEEKGIPPRSFFAEVPKSFAYPLRRDGLIVLTAGTLFFGLLGWIASLSLLGFIIDVLVAGYLCAYMLKIIACSANGDDDMPDWPDLSDLWDDILVPLLWAFFTLAFCQIPAVAYLIGVSHEADVLFWVLTGAGVLYLPMGLTAVALFHTVLALNPILIVGSILKAPLAYCVASLVFLVVYGISLAGQMVLAEALPLGGPILSGFVALYLMVVDMRILGMLYFTNARRLGWFARE